MDALQVKNLAAYDLFAVCFNIYIYNYTCIYIYIHVYNYIYMYIYIMYKYYIILYIDSIQFHSFTSPNGHPVFNLHSGCGATTKYWGITPEMVILIGHTHIYIYVCMYILLYCIIINNKKHISYNYC